MNFLHYILHQSSDSLTKQVYLTLKTDSRKGDFKALTDIDRQDLDIDYTDDQIEDIEKSAWKKFIKERVKTASLIYLCNENSQKEKTRDIMFEELKISDYLEDNRNTVVSKIIFSCRSKTLDMKENMPWKYQDTLCVACEMFDETMDHFMVCEAYSSSDYKDWRNVFGHNKDSQFEAALQYRKDITSEKIYFINKSLVGSPTPTPRLQETVEHLCSIYIAKFWNTD